MSTEKKSVISTLENVIEDFDSIKAGMEYVGLTVGTDSTNTYGDKIKTLKEELDKVESLEIENENLNTQISTDDTNFNNIYNAIVEKGQTPVQEDRSTYAAAILAIESGEGSGDTGVEFTNLAYFFYNNVREPDEYWSLVTNKVTDMNNMLNGATLTVGNTYLIDITSCVTEEAINNLIYNLGYSAAGTVDIEFKVGADNTSLKALIFYSSLPYSTSKNINLSFDENSDLSAIKSIRSAFSGHCFNNIDLSKLSNAPLETMYQAFQYSILLGTCDFNSLDTSKVTTFYNCFYNFNRSAGVTSIDISNWSFESSTTLERMFYSTGLKEINFGDTVLSDQTKKYMFYEAYITSVHLNIVDTLEKYVDNSFMLGNCTKLTQVTSDNPWVLVGNNAGYYMFYGCTNLTQLPEIHLVVLNKSKSTNDSLGYCAFSRCSSLEEVNLYIEYENDGQDTYTVQDCAQMFYGCTSLKDIKGNLDLSYVKTLNYMFYNCSALETIENTGGIGNSTSITSGLTLDLSASAVFDIESYINSLAENISGYTRTIKLNATVYSALTEETIALAATKNYTLASA